eukprot:g6198.t1
MRAATELLVVGLLLAAATVTVADDYVQGEDVEVTEGSDSGGDQGGGGGGSGSGGGGSANSDDEDQDKAKLELEDEEYTEDKKREAAKQAALLKNKGWAQGPPLTALTLQDLLGVRKADAKTYVHEMQEMGIDNLYDLLLLDVDADIDSLKTLKVIHKRRLRKVLTLPITPSIYFTEPGFAPKFCGMTTVIVRNLQKVAAQLRESENVGEMSLGIQFKQMCRAMRKFCSRGLPVLQADRLYKSLAIGALALVPRARTAAIVAQPSTHVSTKEAHTVTAAQNQRFGVIQRRMPSKTASIHPSSQNW